MKIGVFDSGLGGLFLLKAIATKLPRYDYVFLADTKNLPYGNKSQKQIYRLTVRAVKFLFQQDCELVLIACNTSSAQALRQIQQKFLPKNFPDRRVLGVIRPTVELIQAGETCVIATTATAKAKAYTRELRKLNRKINVSEIAAPELVPLLEAGDGPNLDRAVKKYLRIISQSQAKNLILGCTHYTVIKQKFAKGLGKGVKLISQDDFLPDKLQNYLSRHAEIRAKLSRTGHKRFLVSKLNSHFQDMAKQWFGKNVNLELIKG